MVSKPTKRNTGGLVAARILYWLYTGFYALSFMYSGLRENQLSIIR